MPNIVISKKGLEGLLGKKLDLSTVKELVFDNLKGEVDKVEGDELTIDFGDTNRPDLWSVEGVARALRPILGLKQKDYKTTKSSFKLSVDSSVAKVRPFIACAAVKNVKLNNESIKSLIQMQDKLDTTYGRKRKKSSIGIYDLDKINWPVTYTTIKPDEIKFVPLGFEKEMTPKEILKKHPKGEEFGNILSGLKKYPVLVDKKKNVLSMPPIINYDSLGKVTEKSKNLLVEVTGTEKETVNQSLNLVTSALSERGGKLYSVQIDYPEEKQITPTFKGEKHKVDLLESENLLGMKFKIPEAKKLLEKMGYSITKKQKSSLDVMAPFYRKDIMHQVDIIEDLAIAYGYHNFEKVLPEIPTSGELSEQTLRKNKVRELLIGMGINEIFSFNLSNKKILLEQVKRKGEPVEILNPINTNYTCLRNSLVPTMIDFFKANKRVKFPQEVFEVGPIFAKNSKLANKVSQKDTICVGITHPKAGFTEIKSVLDTLLYNLDIGYSIKPRKDATFIDGRCGDVIVSGKKIGVIGEVHPEVLINFDLENPVAVFEIEVDGIWQT